MEKLIEEIQKHPCLYDSRLDEYRDQQIKDYAWEEIAMKLNGNGRVMRQQWKKLRDCYRQATTRRKTNAVSQKLWKPWRYEKQMEFLAPYMSSRVATTNIWDIHKDGDEADEESATNMAGDVGEEREQFSHESIDGDKTRTTNFTTASDDDDEGSLVVTNDLPKLETRSPSFRDGNDKRKLVTSCTDQVCVPLPNEKVSKHQDDLELFFMSACQSTRRLPRRLQNQIKKDLLDSILRAEDLYECETSKNKIPVSPATCHKYCCNN
ncbi:uncharacterized protein [Palaemon carinicauda]|uniref:uncharacterized protein n=1 Tax=Palaemon carinicauda TaxID=392227 RepID=UPI0035B65328